MWQASFTNSPRTNKSFKLSNWNIFSINYEK
ncbi:unnamed protein product [Schistosoma margrebowiei]|uniref:Uncharacterized protein n=1 Tax=Schistosoma margrebowiei TaxID=48269 RepID=A0A3P7YVN6_9TREM|nr:unnamed protein product [Schistosoma margrebowiei]